MIQAAMKTATQEIVVEDVFPHAPETIWKTLTTGELIGCWLLMKPTGFEPVKGVIHCEVLEVTRNKSLAHSWQGGHESNAQEYGSRLDTIVTWTLVKVAGGTRLRLVHSGFVTPKNDPAFWNMSTGWKKVVGRISAISGEQPETTEIEETRK
jgi:uncharacterized protein YndB with AHSA1/START domain